MSATLSRRALVIGAAALTLPRAAVAASVPHADAALFDLGYRLAAADDLCTAAGRAVVDALDRVADPEPPAALFYRAGDDDIGVIQPTYFRDGLAWYGDEIGLVARCRPRRQSSSLCGAYVGWEPDPDGVARVAEIVAADRVWQVDRAAARAAAGMPEANAACDASAREMRDLMAEMASVPVFTLAGVLTKARAVELAFGGADGLDEEIGPEPDGTAETMALAVVRDLLRLVDAGKENARG